MEGEITAVKDLERLFCLIEWITDRLAIEDTIRDRERGRVIRLQHLRIGDLHQAMHTAHIHMRTLTAGRGTDVFVGLRTILLVKLHQPIGGGIIQEQAIIGTHPDPIQRVGLQRHHILKPRGRNVSSHLGLRIIFLEPMIGCHPEKTVRCAYSSVDHLIGCHILIEDGQLLRWVIKGKKGRTIY